jgi:DNA recombination-dependent growth factor C
VKAIKTIKAFIPYAINDELWAWCRKAVRSPDAARKVVDLFIAKDPDDHEWNSMGLVEPMAGEALVHDLDGAAYMLMYQIAERKLPASVRDEKIHERYKELSEREGRPLNKKEFAQLKEDVESQLLPQAFIVRKFIPALVTKDTLLVCTSSVSQCEKILAKLVRLCEVRKVKLEISGGNYEMSPGALLGQIARDGIFDLDYDRDQLDCALHSGKSAKFKGEDKRTITVKDRDLLSDELKKITTDTTYAVTELRIHLENQGDEVSEFTLTDKMIFKGFKLTDVSLAGIGNDTDDLHATYWLLAKEMLRALNAVTWALGEGDADAAADDEEL